MFRYLRPVRSDGVVGATIAPTGRCADWVPMGILQERKAGVLYQQPGASGRLGSNSGYGVQRTQENLGAHQPRGEWSAIFEQAMAQCGFIFVPSDIDTIVTWRRNIVKRKSKIYEYTLCLFGFLLSEFLVSYTSHIDDRDTEQRTYDRAKMQMYHIVELRSRCTTILVSLNYFHIVHKLLSYNIIRFAAVDVV